MRITPALLLLAAAPAFAANYATCILDKMPGTQNATAYQAGVQLCAQQHPDRFFTIVKGGGRGLLAPKSPDACTVVHAKSTVWQPAAQAIRRACDCLYGVPSGPSDMCERYPLPQELRNQHPNISTLDGHIRLEHHYRRIYAAHPDADEVFFSRDFVQWVTQDKARESHLVAGQTKDVIRLLTEFKARNGSFDPSTAVPVR
ncbi:hypothetical protein [Acidovorax sp. BL-A-41-H1]|uniref:hypothetical protein n=1 Tax=Acidovorax sp. BL-A-41-H1 TaxID=3421102 RepID=UPI003F79D3D7